MKNLSDFRMRVIEILIHSIAWGLVFAFPFLLFSREGLSDRWVYHAWRMFVMQLSFVLVFYINYLLVIPKFLFKRKYGEYILVNIFIIVSMLLFMHIWQEFCMHSFSDIDMGKPERIGPPKWVFSVRDAITMILVIGLSVALKMSKKWLRTENEKREAEKNKTEAELKNLRNQINPHFLLNTLNNIYALIAFDTEKAQEAVQELSRLLRYVLYDNQMEKVELVREADFIKSYIELMKIRLSSNVTIDTDIDIDSLSATKIAPLIFISLIENSFKHGISPVFHSYISINIYETDGKVVCRTLNSNYPKSGDDKSGSGIGLMQVKKRLELVYPGRYEWDYGVRNEGKEYFSMLTINTNIHDA